LQSQSCFFFPKQDYCTYYRARDTFSGMKRIKGDKDRREEQKWCMGTLQKNKLKECRTCSAIPGAHKPVRHPCDFARFPTRRAAPDHLLRPPATLSKGRRIERLILPATWLLTIEDWSFFFFFPTQTRLDRISLVNRPISYSINQRDTAREFARYRFFSHRSAARGGYWNS